MFATLTLRTSAPPLKVFIMEELQIENWLDAMIERQALPEEIRKETTAEFCKKWGVPESTYYYHASKEENQKKIIGIALNNAKKHAPEVLENLGVRAKNNTNDTALYLKFILQLIEKADITTDGKPIYFGLSTKE